MMDIKPLISSSESPCDKALLSLHSVFAPKDLTNMIIDATSHNSSSSMPVSPKQGETITAESLSKHEKHVVTSSMTPTSWDHISSSKSSMLSSPPLPTSALLNKTWEMSPPRSVSPAPQTVGDALEAAEKFKPSHMTTECQSWNNSNGTVRTQASSTSSSHHLSSSIRKNLPGHEEPAVSTSGMSARNCDQPDSSPSPQSQLNSSFEESETSAVETNMQHADNMSSHMDASFERRSRRKPTVEDIRRVRPPIMAPYDSEESEIEDDILNEELMRLKKLREADEVDGAAKSELRLNGELRYKEDEENFSADRLSRHEAVDGIPEDDDEEMELRSESDSDADKYSYLKDVPIHIYNLMHEVKVNAHAMFMKTFNYLQPEEAKTRRDQYLLQMLSSLRDRCLEDGIKNEVIASILKDVESEVTLLAEDLEDIKNQRYYSDSDKDSSFNDVDSSDAHFLSRPENKRENGSYKDAPPRDMAYSPSHPPSFFNTTMPSSIPSSSPSSTSSPPDVKPIIVTVSADMKQPPPLISSGGLPPLHPLASNISETAFSPNMFGNSKMPSWFPPGFNNMPLYPFSPGGPLDHALARKFLPFEGKLGENVDKDYLKCQFCERTFRRQKNLENHVENTHQGNGPLKPRRETSDMYFKCSHCPYTTKHQSNLYVHLRIHTGERPYICGACGVQYSQSHSLKSHIINKHEGIMSFYIKEKRTRSPRGMGYLSTQVMHENSIFKLPPPPLLGPPLSHNSMDLVTKAIEMAKSEQQQQQMKQQQQNGDSNGLRNSMPPPLTPTPTSNTPSNTTPSSSKPSPMPGAGSTSGITTPTPSSSMFSTPGSGPHPPFFMNGHPMSPLMFGELPHHLRNPGHHSGPHLSGGPHLPGGPHLFPGFPHFPPHSSSGFHNGPGFSPLSGLSPNTNSSGHTPNSHSLPPHLLPMPHMSSSPIPMLQQQIKKEPQAPPATPISSKPPARSHSDEAIDLRKKSPPLESRESSHAHDRGSCGGKENCAHAAKLKYLRLNVVRMLGILVPNLNFAEKGISAESESVDELLQDVIESNTMDEMMD